jgi:hypothetical protein
MMMLRTHGAQLVGGATAHLPRPPQEAKRRALAIADQRSKENVALREVLNEISLALEQLAETQATEGQLSGWPASLN